MATQHENTERRLWDESFSKGLFTFLFVVETTCKILSLKNSFKVYIFSKN